MYFKVYLLYEIMITAAIYCDHDKTHTVCDGTLISHQLTSNRYAISGICVVRKYISDFNFQYYIHSLHIIYDYTSIWYIIFT